MERERMEPQEMVWYNQKFWYIVFTEFPTGRNVWSEMLTGND